MADQDLKNLLASLKTEDVSVAPDGRVVISNPDIAEKIKGTGIVKPGDLAKDTNIICCGNDNCGGKLDSLIDQMVSKKIGG